MLEKRLIATCCTLSLVTLLVTPTLAEANSDKLAAAAMQACNTMKACALADAQQSDDLTPEMQAMIVNMADRLCETTVFADNLADHHELAKPATACFKSISKLSCEALMEGEVKTPACDKYEQLAEKYR